MHLKKSSFRINNFPLCNGEFVLFLKRCLKTLRNKQVVFEPKAQLDINQTFSCRFLDSAILNP
jgi:hypothetical protein